MISTRDLILDAAEHRFAERGFAGVAVREIAADVGLRNQASLYNHFRNKEALYEAVLTRGLSPIVAVVVESGQVGAANATRGTMDARVVDAFLDRVLDYLAEHPHLPRLIQRAALDDVKYLRSSVRRLLRPLYAQGMQALDAAGGPWGAADLPLLAAGLYHLIFGYFANAQLLRLVADADPLSPAALAHQRSFLKAAVAQLLGLRPAQRLPGAVRSASRR